MNKILLMGMVVGTILLTGCAGTSRVVRQLSKDPATAYISATTPYGNLKIIRANPGTNVTVSVTPEGAVTVSNVIR